MAIGKESRTHDLLHRSEHKWPEKALVRRIQILTEQLELAAEPERLT